MEEAKGVEEVEEAEGVEGASAQFIPSKESVHQLCSLHGLRRRIHSPPSLSAPSPGHFDGYT